MVTVKVNTKEVPNSHIVTNRNLFTVMNYMQFIMIQLNIINTNIELNLLVES